MILFVAVLSFAMFRWFAALMNNTPEAHLATMAGGNLQGAAAGENTAFSHGFAPATGAGNVPAAGITDMVVANAWSPHQWNCDEVTNTSAKLHQPSPVKSHVLSHMPELGHEFAASRPGSLLQDLARPRSVPALLTFAHF